MENTHTIGNINSQEENKEKREVFIYPAKISRRILCFLSDIIVNLMVALLIFQSLAIPIAYTATNYGERSTQNAYHTNYRTQILYDNNLLFSKDDKERFIFEQNLITTSNRFNEYFVTGTPEIYDVSYNYFINIKKESIDSLNAMLLKAGEKYFDVNNFNSNGTYALKQEYKDLFRPNFVYGDELSKDGQKEYSLFSQEVFLEIYGNVINDIKKIDLTTSITPDLKSYNYYDKAIKEFDGFYHILITVSSYISFFLATIIMCFIVPMFTSKHQTVSEKILRLERIDLNNFNYLNKIKVAEVGFVSTLTNLCILMFVPMATVGFNKMFVFSYLTSVSVVGAIAIILQLVLLCVTKLNRTLKELSTNSIVCDTEIIDEYYKELGYGK